MTTKDKPNWQVSESPLICGHTALYRNSPPKKGDIVWCYKCWSYSTVIDNRYRKSEEVSR